MPLIVYTCNCKFLPLEIILFSAYLILFAWAITQTKFFSRSGLSNFQLVVLFLFKVATGVLYGWLNWNQGANPGTTDTWVLHKLSLKETEVLLRTPVKYISSFFYNPYENSFFSLFSSKDSYWNDLKSNSYIRIESIFNCFSLGSYFINIIFYSFITFFGVAGFYKVMRSHLKTEGALLIIACFMIPSFLYWTSGLHKDGLTFLALSTIIYITYFGSWRKRPAISISVFILSILLLFVLRNHVLLVLLPALFCWMLAKKFPQQRIAIFAFVYGLGVLAFFGLRYINPAFDFPAIVLDKQNAFINLTGGNSSVTVQKPEPTVTGFLKTLPQAIGISMFRPYWGDIKKLIIAPAFLEVILVWLCIVFYLLIPRQPKRFRPLSLFLLFFTISMLLMIGYSVNNLGAVVRYRSILLPLILAPALTNINWKRLCLKSNIK